MEKMSHTAPHTERGTGNLRTLDHKLKARGYKGLGSGARQVLKKVRTRKRRHLKGDDLPTL